VRHRLLLVLPVLLGLLAAAGAAPAAAQVTATSPQQIADRLLDDPVYVEDGAAVPLDADRVRDAIGQSSVPTYVVAVSSATAEAAGGAGALVPAVGRELGGEAAVLVVTDAGQLRAAEGGSAAERGVDAAIAVEQALAAGGSGAFDEAGVTAVLTDFVQRVDRQSAGGTGGGTGTDGTGTGGTGTGGGAGAGALLPLLLLGLLGGGAYALSRSRRGRSEHARTMQDARADVESLHARLGSDVQTLAPGDDAVARQALADAAERYSATGALMAKADTEGEWAAARRTAVEGLTAARVVRERLGLDPGPEIPMPAADAAPRLEQPARVQVGEQQFEGSPGYTPGRPHYFEGGYYGGRPVPGGWYAKPFWQTMLLTSVLGSRRRPGYGGYGGYGRGMGGGLLGGGVLGGAAAGTRRPRSGSSGSWGGGRSGGRSGGGSWGGGGRVGGGSWGGGSRGGGGGRRGGRGSW
jgi:hypothetical protein